MKNPPTTEKRPDDYPPSKEMIEARMKAAVDRMVWVLRSAMKVAPGTVEKGMPCKTYRAARRLRKGVYRVLGEVAPEATRPTKAEKKAGVTKAPSRKLL